MTISIAIIEDNLDLNQMIVEDLVSSGFTTTGFHSAEEFSADASNYDLLIIDINLPGEDGITLSKRLRQTDQSTTIIALSARKGTKNRIIAYNAGVDIYLEKPISTFELIAIIKRHAGRPPQMDALQNTITQEKTKLAGHTLIGPSGQAILNERERSILVLLSAKLDRKATYEECLNIARNNQEINARNVYDTSSAKNRSGVKYKNLHYISSKLGV